MKRSILFLLLITCWSCYTEPEETTITTLGLKPIYLNLEGATNQAEAPREIIELGKIICKGQHIFINDRFTGIHVINNKDPHNPEKEFFWSIPGNIDFTITDDILYADNSEDLLTFKISDDYSNIDLVNTIKNIYPERIDITLFPEDYFGTFECVDPSKGIVTRWEEAELTNPKCRR